MHVAMLHSLDICDFIVLPYARPTSLGVKKSETVCFSGIPVSSTTIKDVETNIISTQNTIWSQQVGGGLPQNI